MNATIECIALLGRTLHLYDGDEPEPDQVGLVISQPYLQDRNVWVLVLMADDTVAPWNLGPAGGGATRVDEPERVRAELAHAGSRR